MLGLVTPGKATKEKPALLRKRIKTAIKQLLLAYESIEASLEKNPDC